MSEMLDPDKVAALVEAAKQGQLPEQRPGAAQRRGQRLRTVDFSRPTKFTSDHQRRIARAIDTFCQTSVTRLSTELRSPIELEAINTAQATWSGAQSQLPAGSLFVTLDVQPLGTRMLFTVEQSFVLMCLDSCSAARPTSRPRERRFSEIDRVLTQRLFESLVHQLSLVWQDLAGDQLSIVEIETHNDTSQIAAVSEPTFVVVIESRINKHSASMALLIPWLAIDPVGERLSGKEAREPEAESAGAAEIGRAMAGVPVDAPRRGRRDRAADRRDPLARARQRDPAGRPGRSGRHGVRRERQARPRPAGQQRRPAGDPDFRNREEVRMSQQPDITPREALMRLGASTAEAIAKVLEMFVPGAVERGEVTVLADGASPFANVARGSIASSVSYVDGVTGANVFVLDAGRRPRPRRRDGRAAGGGRGRRAGPVAVRARDVRDRRGRQPDDGRRGRRDRRRARAGDRDLRPRHPRARRSRLGRRHLRHRPARHLDHVPDRRRVVPPDPARAQRVRRPHGARDRRGKRREHR